MLVGGPGPYSVVQSELEKLFGVRSGYLGQGQMEDTRELWVSWRTTGRSGQGGREAFLEVAGPEWK